MKILILLFVGLTQILFCSELTHITLENQDFSIVTEKYDIYDSKGEVMTLYKEERNRNLTFILNLILKDSTGTCADKSMQEGSYEINGTEITLYSLWERRGKAYEAPYGARIMKYQMLDDHSVVKRSSYIYIESERKNYNDESGMQYLFKEAKTVEEKALFKSYIDEMERVYKGQFLLGKDAKKLLNQVDEALLRKKKNQWK